ncbi:MAG: acyl carrier protein [Ruminiclostridium sp.]|nr:acyl carrier protein [Ruminiclostridium sp.]
MNLLSYLKYKNRRLYGVFEKINIHYINVGGGLFIMEKLVIEKVLLIVNEYLPMSVKINQIDDDLIHFGIDSIMLIRIVVSVEEAFQIEIPDDKLLLSEMDTVTKIANIVMSTI